MVEGERCFREFELSDKVVVNGSFVQSPVFHTRLEKSIDVEGGLHYMSPLLERGCICIGTTRTFSSVTGGEVCSSVRRERVDEIFFIYQPGRAAEDYPGKIFQVGLSYK